MFNYFNKQKSATEIKNQSIINNDDTAFIDRTIDLIYNKDYYDRSNIE